MGGTGLATRTIANPPTPGGSNPSAPTWSTSWSPQRSPHRVESYIQPSPKRHDAYCEASPQDYESDWGWSESGTPRVTRRPHSVADDGRLQIVDDLTRLDSSNFCARYRAGNRLEGVIQRTSGLRFAERCADKVATIRVSTHPVPSVSQDFRNRRVIQSPATEIIGQPSARSATWPPGSDTHQNHEELTWTTTTFTN